MDDAVHATFFQKVILTVIAGFFAACLVWFYQNIVEGGNRAVNGAYTNTTGFSSSSRR